MKAIGFAAVPFPGAAVKRNAPLPRTGPGRPPAPEAGSGRRL